MEIKDIIIYSIIGAFILTCIGSLISLEITKKWIPLIAICIVMLAIALFANIKETEELVLRDD